MDLSKQMLATKESFELWSNRTKFSSENCIAHKKNLWADNQILQNDHSGD